MRAAVYCRISDDREGRELGVQRQEQDCRERAAREGWTVVRVWTDNDLSASTRSKKRRPAYEEMLAAAERGQIDVILSYSCSRLTRRPMELEALIALHDRVGVLFRTVASGDVDLSRADGRAVARTLAAWDSAEAERTGERVARAIKQRAEEGRNHGGKRAFGFRVVPGDVLSNGKRGPSTVELVPKEADAIRDAIDVVIAAGKEATIYKIARRWDAAGLRRVYGGLWAEHPSKLKECLINWKNAAVVVHKGQPPEQIRAAEHL